METRDLEYLLAVADHGSIGRAAEQLGISQPALSKAMARLEREVGFPLFERTPRGMTPSAAGSILLARARKMQLEYEDAMCELDELRAGAAGQIRFGFSPTTPQVLLLDACRQMLRERPAARLKLRERPARDLIDSLLAGELDLLVARIPTNPVANVSAQPLYTDELFVVADAGHPLHQYDEVPLELLGGQDWLLPAPELLLFKEIQHAFDSLALPHPKLRIESESGHNRMLHLLVGSRIIGVCSARSLASVSGLRPLRIAGGSLSLTRHIGLLCRTSAYLSPLIRRFMEIIEQHAGASEPPRV